MKLKIRPATLAEARWIGPRLRPEDRLEVETATGKTVEEALLQSIAISAECYTIRFNNERDPVAIFGVGPRHSSFGVPWLMATPEVTRGSLALLWEAPIWFERWIKKYPDGLINIADTRNELHLRWLTAIGCALWHTIKRNGHEFIYFSYN